MPDRVIHFLQGELEQFDVLFEKAPIFMHSIDNDGRLLRVSTFWADALGYSRDEMIGRRSVDFLTPESQAHAKDHVFPEFFRTGTIKNVDYEFVRKDGSVLPVLLSAVAQTDADGKFLHSLAIMFDNSEAKRAMAIVHRTQVTEAVGRLVGGVAHDFNNLLTVIMGNLEFLQDDFNHPSREVFLHDAIGAARRGAYLTQQLLAFGRRAYLRPQFLDLNAVVRETDSMMQRLVPANIQLETVTTGGLWSVKLDRAPLDTALLNVLNNAQDAMPSGGTITIETANVRLGEEYIADRDEEVAPGRFAMIAISDTGSGMTQDVVARACEPFFTTKAIGKGAGLGLSMVHGFVRQSGGTLRIYSEMGIGTTVRLYFPATVGKGPKSEEVEEPQGVAEPSIMADVLLVEDEPEVRKVLLRQLSQHGMRVAEASTGDLAHGLLMTGYRPKVLVTDVVMPGKVQGHELARLARELIPDLKVVLLSGYPREAMAPSNAFDDLHLVKPVNRQQLVQTIVRLLGEDG